MLVGSFVAWYGLAWIADRYLLYNSCRALQIPTNLFSVATTFNLLRGYVFPAENLHLGRTAYLLQLRPPLAHGGHGFKLLGPEALFCVSCFRSFPRAFSGDWGWCSGRARQLTQGINDDDLHRFRPLNYVRPGMATKRTPNQPEQLTNEVTRSRVATTLDEKGRKVPDFGAPIPVAKEDLPPRSKRGGRISNEPAMRQWLTQLQPGNTYELGSQDDDGGHPLNRVTQLRKIAGDKYEVTTSPLIVGKRYRVFVQVK